LSSFKNDYGEKSIIQAIYLGPKQKYVEFDQECDSSFKFFKATWKGVNLSQLTKEHFVALLNGV
jgi:hypothetical protein